MTTEREIMVATLAQMIAPRLFVLSGDNPAEMGFPITDTEEELEERLARQFSPIEFWTARAEEIAEAVVSVVWGEGTVPQVTDAMIAKSAEWGLKWQPSESGGA